MKRLIYAGCTAAMLALVGMPTFSIADDAAASSDSRPDWQAKREQRRANRQEIMDARLVGFKASLALTSDQEKNWPAFESALRNLAVRGDHGRPDDKDKADKDATPSPVDVMRRIAERSSQRAAKLTALADATGPLYGSLDDKQKLIFRATLKEMWRARRGHGDHHRD